MGSFAASLVVGFLLGSLSVWLVNLVNGRSSREENAFLLFQKRAKRD